jgi:hypothetical protein
MKSVFIAASIAAASANTNDQAVKVGASCVTTNSIENLVLEIPYRRTYLKELIFIHFMLIILFFHDS